MKIEENSIQTRKNIGHHPLVWWILPCLWGIAISFGFPEFFSQNALLFIASFFSVALLCVVFKKPQKSTHFLWYTGYALAVFCFSMVFFKKRFLFFSKTIPAPREISATIKVTKILRASNAYGKTLCIGTIESSSGPRVLEGQQVYISLPETALIASDQLELFGVIEPLGLLEDGFFKYLRTIGVFHKLHNVKVLNVLRSEFWLELKREQWARGWELFLQNVYAFERYAPLYASMVLGNKGLIDAELKERFGLAGCLHLFAVSGLHVGIFAGLLLRVLSRFRYGVWVAAPFVFGYVWLTGLAPSALRAFVMLFLIWVARSFFRRPETLSALLASVFIAFVLAPQTLLSAGFQLSHAVVAGFIFMGVPLGQYFRKTDLNFGFLQKILNSLSSAFFLSLSATVFSAPFLIMHFQKMSFMGLFSNLVAVPLGSLALVFAWCATLTSFLGLGPVFNTLACSLLWFLDFLFSAVAPLTQKLTLSLEVPPSWCIIFWFCLLGCVIGLGGLRRPGTCPWTRK